MSECLRQFAVLGSQIHKWGLDTGKRIILIASAVQGEGKSFVALKLAATIAGTGESVLLVDGDMRAPSLHRSLDISPRSGFSAFLEGRANISECLHSTKVKGVSVIPADVMSPASPLAFAGARLHESISGLRALDRAQYVLIDSSAILAAPEVRILAASAETVLMVVAANQTPRSAVANALGMINGAPIFGAVMNRFEPSFSAARAVKRANTASRRERSE